MDISWKTVKNADNVMARSAAVKEMIAACKPGQNIYLTDCIVRSAYEGVYVLMELAKLEETALMSGRAPMKWKLLCMLDEWGNVPNPGDKVIKTQSINMKNADGTLVKPVERNIAINDGSYGELFEHKTEYVVDNKGCIECSKTDAVHFLHRYGVHSRTNRAMTTRRATSTEPVLRRDGQRMYVHYRRFKEVEPKNYEQLADRKPTGELKLGEKNENRKHS